MRAECLTVLLLALLPNTLASDEQQVKKVNATKWLFKMSPNDHFCQDNCLLWPVKMRCEDAIAWYGYITRGVQKLTSPDSFFGTFIMFVEHRNPKSFLIIFFIFTQASWLAKILSTGELKRNGEFGATDQDFWGVRGKRSGEGWLFF